MVTYNIMLVATKTKLVIDFNDKSVSFSLDSLVSKTVNKYLKNKYLFTPLEEYLTYKGVDYSERLFQSYVEASDVINAIGGSDEIGDIIVTILNTIDIEDIEHFLSSVYMATPPSVLKERFTEDMWNDPTINREQTYTVSEYFGIAALSLIAKVIIGPIAEYMMINSLIVSKDKKELAVYAEIKRANVFTSQAAIKLYSFINKIYSKKSGEVGSVYMLLHIGEEDIIDYIFSTLFIKKFMTFSIDGAGDDVNLITMSNSVINSFIDKMSKVKVVDTISLKEGKDTGNDDEESVAEIVRISSDLPIAYPLEFDFAMMDGIGILNRSGIEYDPEVYYDALEFTKNIQNGDITDAVKFICSYVLFREVPPQAFNYMSIVDNESSIGGFRYAIAAVFTWLWCSGLKELALIVATVEVPDGNYSNFGSRKQIPKATVDELSVYYSVKHYPSTRVEREKGVQENRHHIDALVKVSDMLYKTNLYTIANNKYIEDRDRYVSIPLNIKPMLGEMLKKILQGV